MDEVFDLVQQDLSATGFNGKLSAGVVLTGGAAAMLGVVELASEVFGTGVRVGVPSDHLGGLIEAVNSPRYAHMLPTAPGQSATVLVALAMSGDRPSQTMAGNVTSVPPPATELTALPTAAARKMRMNDGKDNAAV
jgi:cell division ATPase FtsA